VIALVRSMLSCKHKRLYYDYSCWAWYCRDCGCECQNLCERRTLERLEHVSFMLERAKDSIGFRFTRVLKPQRPDKNLSNFLIVAVDSEYLLPVYLPEDLKKRSDLPPECTKPRPNFRTFQMACQGKVTHWKLDRQISSTELCSWVLSNLKVWGVDFRAYRAIVVCSHYLLAEIQHLTDAKERFKAWGSTLYGEISFEPDQWINFNPYSPEIELEFQKTKFKFVDTYSLFGMSLEKLTDQEGNPYPKIKEDYNWHGHPWSYWRKNPHLLFAEDEGKFWQYADNDCLGLLWCLEYWRRWVWDRWSIDILRTRTFSGIGLRILKSKIKEPTEPYVIESYLDKRGRPKKRIAFDPEMTWVRDFYLDGYCAGRREVYERGFIAEPVYAYDISKEYTTAAIIQPLPSARTKFGSITDKDGLNQYEGMLKVQFEFPEKTEQPCLPVIDLRYPKQVYPLKGNTTCGVAEVRLAKKLGAKVHIIRSCVFKPTESEINHPLRQVLEEILALANEGKGTPQERFMKSIANGLVGKLFQRNHLEQLERWKPDVVTEASESSWSPIWAALILSRARAIYSEILTLGNPVYGHTDSIFSRTPIDLDAPINRELKKHGSEGLRLECVFSQFWTPRSACYYGQTEDGKIRNARQGIAVSSDDFVRVLEPKVGDRNAPNETVFLGLKMATFKDKYLSKGLLGHEIGKKTETTFEYDHKRRLLNPDANLWSESTKTVPWTSIEELLETVTIKKDRAERKLKTGFKQAGRVGRPKVVSDKDRTEMLLLLKQGVSRHQIAKRFQGKYGMRTVYRSLPK